MTPHITYDRQAHVFTLCFPDLPGHTTATLSLSDAWHWSHCSPQLPLTLPGAWWLWLGIAWGESEPFEVKP